MLKHLLENNLNTPDQHGFTKSHSCLTHSMLETFESWTEDIVLVLFFWVFKKHLTKSRKKEVVAETICLWNMR